MTASPHAPPGYVHAPSGQPFCDFMAPLLFETGPNGEAVVGGRTAFRVEEHHLNAGRVCHGGMLTTFADVTLGTCAWAACQPSGCVTLSMQSQFLKPARLGDLVECVPELTARTREILFVRGACFAGGDLIFTATALWKIVKTD